MNVELFLKQNLCNYATYCENESATRWKKSTCFYVNIHSKTRTFTRLNFLGEISHKLLISSEIFKQKCSFIINYCGKLVITLECDWKSQHANHYVCSTKSIFLRDFLVILKLTLQTRKSRINVSSLLGRAGSQADHHERLYVRFHIFIWRHVSRYFVLLVMK